MVLKIEVIPTYGTSTKAFENVYFAFISVAVTNGTRFNAAQFTLLTKINGCTLWWKSAIASISNKWYVWYNDILYYSTNWPDSIYPIL